MMEMNDIARPNVYLRIHNYLFNQSMGSDPFDEI